MSIVEIEVWHTLMKMGSSRVVRIWFSFIFSLQINNNKSFLFYMDIVYVKRMIRLELNLPQILLRVASLRLSETEWELENDWRNGRDKEYVSFKFMKWFIVKFCLWLQFWFKPTNRLFTWTVICGLLSACTSFPAHLLENYSKYTYLCKSVFVVKILSLMIMRQ